MNPLDLWDLLGSTLVLLTGVAIGRKMRPKPPKPLRPICSCEHGYGSHEDGRRCHGKADEPTRYNQFGDEIAWKKVQCTCLRYDGPDPAIFGLEKL